MKRRIMLALAAMLSTALVLSSCISGEGGPASGTTAAHDSRSSVSDPASELTANAPSKPQTSQTSGVTTKSFAATEKPDIPFEYLEKLNGQTVRILVVNHKVEEDPFYEYIRQRDEKVEAELGVRIVYDYYEDIKPDAYDPLSDDNRRVYQNKSSRDMLNYLYSSETRYDAVFFPSDCGFLSASSIDITDSNTLAQYGYKEDECLYCPFMSVFRNYSMISDDSGRWFAGEIGGYDRFYSGSVDRKYMPSLGVAFVDRQLFDQYANEIAALPQSGGCSDLDEIVAKGYWTLDLLLAVQDLLAKDGAGSFLISNDGGEQREQVDLLLAGCGAVLSSEEIKTRTVESGNRFSNESCFFAASALKSAENSAAIGKIYTVLSSCADSTQKAGVQERFRNGKLLFAVDALENAKSYETGGKSACVLPLPMLNHEQFNPADPSLGYRTALVQRQNYACVGVLANYKRTDTVEERERYRYTCAVLDLMAYYGEQILDKATAVSLGVQDQIGAVRFIQKGLFHDFTRTWGEETGRSALLYEIVIHSKDGGSIDAVLQKISKTHNENLALFTKDLSVHV